MIQLTHYVAYFAFAYCVFCILLFNYHSINALTYLLTNCDILCCLSDFSAYGEIRKIRTA